MRGVAVPLPFLGVLCSGGRHFCSTQTMTLASIAAGGRSLFRPLLARNFEEGVVASAQAATSTSQLVSGIRLRLFHAAGPCMLLEMVALAVVPSRSSQKLSKLPRSAEFCHVQSCEFLEGVVATTLPWTASNRPSDFQGGVVVSLPRLQLLW